MVARDILDDARMLLDAGEIPENIAARLGTTLGALDQAFRRCGDSAYLPFSAANRRRYPKVRPGGGGDMASLTREKKHAVVASLARGRSVAMTAERCHVSADLVMQLRDRYGPDLPQLEAAARELAKAPPRVAQLRPAATPPTGTHEPPATPKDFPMTTAPASPTPTGPVSFPAILDDIDAHRESAKVNAEIAELEKRLADARAKLAGATT